MRDETCALCGKPIVRMRCECPPELQSTFARQVEAELLAAATRSVVSRLPRYFGRLKKYLTKR